MSVDVCSCFSDYIRLGRSIIVKYCYDSLETSTRRTLLQNALDVVDMPIKSFALSTNTGNPSKFKSVSWNYDRRRHSASDRS